MTETDPEWSDDDRAQMLGLAIYEAGICDCGFHESLTSDLSNHFQPGIRVCNVCAGNDMATRVYAAADEAENKRLGDNAPPTVTRPTDGRHRTIKRLSEAEVEQQKRERGRSRGGQE